MQLEREQRQRMYFLTMYNISPIQQGIQSLHAVVEYAQLYFNTPEYQRWATKDKTVILLNGGTSNIQGWNLYDGLQNKGSMELHIDALVNAGVKCAAFNEPDLNNATSSVAFLVPEQVWDRELYPDPTIDVKLAADIFSKEDRQAYIEFELNRKMVEMYGEQVAFLRKYLSRLRLA